jgi:16S rRNA U516 pseudouridylate synthase RsuA-like enzyme
VLRLKRMAFGPIRLGTLPRGRSRPLSPAEIRALRSAVFSVAPR